MVDKDSEKDIRAYVNTTGDRYLLCGSCTHVFLIDEMRWCEKHKWFVCTRCDKPKKKGFLSAIWN